MIETMPEMAKKLLDKCETTEGSKESRDYQVIYDFFCLEEMGIYIITLHKTLKFIILLIFLFVHV
jgi:hypothetical protein